MPARWSRTHISAKILSMKRSSRVSLVSQCTTSLSVAGSIFGGASISCSCAVASIDGRGYVVSPLDRVNGAAANYARSGQPAGGPPLLESFDVRVSEQQCAMRNVGFFRLVEHEAENVVDLRQATAFDVTQHRRRVLRVPLGERLLPRPHKALARRVTVGGCDGGTTPKLVEEKLAAIGSADNLANIRPHQTGHRSRSREVNQLFPHPLNNNRDREGFDALRGSEQGCQRSHAFGHLAGLLAKGERPPIVELADCAVRRAR